MPLGPRFWGGFAVGGCSVLQDLTPASGLINPNGAGNSLSSPRMGLDGSKKILPRTPAVGRDVLVYWEHWELLGLMPEWSVNLGTWYLCKWKFRTVRKSLGFLLKLPLNQHQETQALFLSSPIIMEEMQGGRGDISSDVLSIVPQPPLYPR